MRRRSKNIFLNILETNVQKNSCLVTLTPAINAVHSKLGYLSQTTSGNFLGIP